MAWCCVNLCVGRLVLLAARSQQRAQARIPDAASERQASGQRQSAARARARARARAAPVDVEADDKVRLAVHAHERRREAVARRGRAEDGRDERGLAWWVGGLVGVRGGWRLMVVTVVGRGERERESGGGGE